jgi:peroxiredoxin (alkyl hydroperoxide reductase subunit C)
MSERAIFMIDKKGIIRFIHVGDINRRPDLGMIVNQLKKPKNLN